MKKNIISLVILATASVLPLNAQSVATLKLQGLPDGTVITAEQSATFRTEKPVAEATLSGGSCTMTIPVGAEPRCYAFKVKGRNGYIAKLVTVSGEKPTVEADVARSENESGLWYSCAKQTVTGSPLHAEYVLRIDSHRDRLDIAYKAIHGAVADAVKKTDKDFTRLEHLFFDDVKATYSKIAANNKDTWWGPFAMLSLYSYFTPEQKAELEQFPDSVRNSYYGQILTNQISPKGLTGTAVADFDIVGADGKTTKLSKAVKGKRAYLVDFWASWCKPCRKEIPNLKAIYGRYGKKGLEIVSISIDKSDTAWKKALSEEKLPWHNGIDRTGINDLFNVKAIPAIFIVDGKTNTILAENLRGEMLEKKLAEIFE